MAMLARRALLAAIVSAALAGPRALAAGAAPGAPGANSVWGPAQKSFLGTALGDSSRVYFTGYRGIVSEVFYPVLDTVESVDLQFLVGDSARTFVDEEKLQSYAASRPAARSMRWRVVTSNGGHGWRITKDVFTDPGRDALVMRVTFEALGGRRMRDFNLYLLHNPSMDNSGADDTSRTLSASGRTMMVASQGARASALAVSRPWLVANGAPMVSNGFVGASDGWTDLLGGAADKRMNWSYDSASGGNIAQMGWIDPGRGGASRLTFDVVLAFGATEQHAMNTANATLASDLGAASSLYDSQWQSYAAGLDDQGGTADDEYYLAAMSLKSIQDKSNGAMIAGMGTPWGDESGDANMGGYHLVWARDLFKFANALVTAGDIATGQRIVQYLFTVLQETADCGAPDDAASPTCPQGYTHVGRFPQNAWVSGWQYWRGTQLDEQAMPILLAWRVYQKGDAATRAQVNALWPRIRAAADFVVAVGPWTQQERWEENSGYSPSSIAAEIAGLVAAAEFARMNGDAGSAGRYLAAADYWQQNVAAWTFTSTGSLGDHRYYIRLNTAARSGSGRGPHRYDPSSGPDEPLTIRLGNGGGSRDQREVVDGGFLELVRMGVKRADDASIVQTLPEYDATLKQTIAGKGDAWFRYNFDGYGERNDGGKYDSSNGRGRLWPIFTAERGMYEIARSGAGNAGAPYLAAVRAFATPEGFIPEQVWNNSATIAGWQVTTPSPYVPGAPTRSMAPLNWAMGEYISLLASIRAGAVVDMPSIVCGRYHTCTVPPAAGQVAAAVNVTATTVPGEWVYVTGNVPELGSWNTDAGTPGDPATYPVWKSALNLPAGTAIQYKYYRKNADGTVAWEKLPGGGNRSLTTPASGIITVTDTVNWDAVALGARP